MLVVAAMGGAACRSPSAGEVVDLGASLQYEGPAARKQDKEAGPFEELSPVTGTTCSNWDVPGDCDDRHKMYERSPPVVHKMARYTIAFLDNQARKDGRLICEDGKCRIIAKETVHEELGCQDGKVRFGDSKAFAVCSGLLIEASGSYYGLTANHCYNPNHVQEGSPAIVGVFSSDPKRDALSEIPESWVFTVEGKEPVGRSDHICYGSSNFGPDWAVVRLVPSSPRIPAARGVPIDSLVSAETAKTPQLNRCDRQRELCVVSHSLRTEATWACSSLYKSRDDGYWVTGLDFYRKGSGAPVWTETGALVGLGVCSFWPRDQCKPDCHDFGTADLKEAIQLPAYPNGIARPSLGTWVSPLRATMKSKLDALTMIREDSAKRKNTHQRNLRRSRR